jgi:hypothetical protein
LKCDKEPSLVTLDTFFDEGKYAEFIEGNQEKKDIFYSISSDIEKMNWPVTTYLESQALSCGL